MHNPQWSFLYVIRNLLHVILAISLPPDSLAAPLRPHQHTNLLVQRIRVTTKELLSWFIKVRDQTITITNNTATSIWNNLNTINHAQ
jgi:hypothetical protein